MARARLSRRSTRRTGVLAAVAVAMVALGALGGVAAVGREAGAAGAAADGAVRAVRATMPDVAALPPVVVDRVVDAVAERPGPRPSGPDAVLLGGLVALLVATTRASTSDRRRGHPVGARVGPGSTRAPPVAR